MKVTVEISKDFKITWGEEEKEGINLFEGIIKEDEEKQYIKELVEKSCKVLETYILIGLRCRIEYGEKAAGVYFKMLSQSLEESRRKLIEITMKNLKTEIWRKEIQQDIAHLEKWINEI